MKKLTALILAAMMIAVLFAGCGGGGNTSTTAATTTAATTAGGNNATTAATTTTEAAQPGYGGVMPEDQIEYINYEAEVPLIAEGYDNITLSAGVMVELSFPNNPVDNWLWDFCEGDLGITIDAAQIQDTEKLNLLMASNQLPDFFMGVSFGTADQMKYGHDEKMLLNYAPYLENYMPSLAAWYESDPSAKPNYVVTADGDMYAQPRITSKEGTFAWYIHYAWYGLLGKVDPESDTPYEGLPTSIEELTNDLITFRDTDPATFGVEQIMPIAGIYSENWGSPMGVLMESFGYLYRAYFRNWTNAALFLPSLHQTDDGVETFGMGVVKDHLYDYLAIQNDWYNENLYSPDYFTADSAQLSAWNASGYHGVEATGEGHWQWKTPGWDYPDTVQGPALTSSERQIKPYTANYPVYGTSGYFMSAACEYPELLCRFFDLFWHDDWALVMEGNPIEGIHNTYGYLGKVYGDNPVDDDLLVHNLGWYYPTDEDRYGDKHMAPTYMGQCLNEGTPERGYNALAARVLGIDFGEDDATNLTGWDKMLYNAEKNYALKQEQYAAGECTLRDVNCANPKWTIALQEARGCYGGNGFEQPLRYVYRNQETTDKIADLTAVLNPYMMEQTALFITGRRSLDEVGAYQAELKTMGIDEYNEILNTEYDAFLKAFGMDTYLPAPGTNAIDLG